LAILVAVSPHFKSDNGEIWHDGTDLGHRTWFCKSRSGICPLGENFYQKFEIFVIFSYLSPLFYTHNVKIVLKRTDGLKNPLTKQIFVKITQGA